MIHYWSINPFKDHINCYFATRNGKKLLMDSYINSEVITCIFRYPHYDIDVRCDFQTMQQINYVLNRKVQDD